MKKKTATNKTSLTGNGYQQAYPLLIVLITLFVWWPVTQLDFVNWDDVTYLTLNQAVQNFNISALFQDFYAGNYHPLTMLSLAIEHKFSGLNPASFHRTNLLLHCLNAFLVYRLLIALSISSNFALIGTLFFALHPLRVESVAWVAERKDVLYAAFWLTSALAWIQYRKQGNSIWWILAILAFLFSCLSKAMAVTLIPFLILIEYLQARKITLASLLPALPFLLIALATGILAIYAQGDALGLQGNYNVLQRIILVNYGLWFYVFKTIIPAPLSAFYPYPESIPGWWYALPLLSIGAAAILYKFPNKFITVGVLIYLVILLPVAQIIPVGQALVADRYSYLPVLGLLFILLGLLEKMTKSYSIKESNFMIGFIPVLAVLAWMCRDRIKVWQNSISLYENVLLQYPDYSTGYVNYGNALRDKGDWNKAERAYYSGVLADAQNDLPWNNMGILASFRKQPEKAVYFYSKAAALKPDFPVNQYNIATVWFNQGKPAKALPAAEKALAIDPNYPEALHLRGVLLQQLQRYPESVVSFQQALKFKPDDIQIYNDLGTTYFYAGSLPEAEASFRKSLELNPDANPNAYNNLGYVLFNSGRQNDAIEMYKKAAAQGHPEAKAYLQQLQQAGQLR